MPLQFDPGAYLDAWKIGQANQQRPDFKTNVTDPLMKGLDLFEEMDYKKKALLAAQQKDREDKAIPLAKNLTDQGLHPEEVTNVVNNFIATGRLKLPSMRAKVVGNEPDIGPISTREPIKYGKPKNKKVLYAFNAQNQKFTEQEVPEGVDPTVVHYDTTPRRVAGGTKGDPNGMSTADLRAIVNQKSRRLESLIQGTDEYQAAIDDLKPYEEVLKSRLPHVKPSPGQPPAPSGKKSLTLEEAKGILQRFNGDKEKARQWAQSQGYQF